MVNEFDSQASAPAMLVEQFGSFVTRFISLGFPPDTPGMATVTSWFVELAVKPTIAQTCAEQLERPFEKY
jgi:hypothetical protein